MSTDLERLKALAMAATPGDWTAKPHGRIVAGPHIQYVNGTSQAQIAMFMSTASESDITNLQQQNTEYCAVANPAAVLALLSRLERAEARIAELEAQGEPLAWRPIKSAPRDGSHILIRFGEDGVSQAKYIAGLPHPWRFIDTNNGASWLLNLSVDGQGGPSHWMPMPTHAQPVQADALDAAPQAGMAAAWVSVNDCLPPLNTPVLTLTAWGDMLVEEWVDYAVSACNMNQDLPGVGNGWCENELADITHWMPLPAIDAAIAGSKA